MHGIQNYTKPVQDAVQNIPQLCLRSPVQIRVALIGVAILPVVAIITWKILQNHWKGGMEPAFTTRYTITSKPFDAGGNAVIVRALESTSNTMQALKFTKLREYCRDVVAVTNSLVDSKTPHLTYVHDIHQITVQNRLSDLIDGSGNLVVNPRYQPEDVIVVAMELMEGNLDSILPSSTETEKLVFTIQRIFTAALLNRHGVQPSDLKTRNVLIRKLTANDYFNGKRMIDYGYWKYRFGNIEAYLPRPKYLIKLTDYDEWAVSINEEGQSNLAPFRMESHLKRIKPNCDLSSLFPKPKSPSATVLDVITLP